MHCLLWKFCLDAFSKTAIKLTNLAQFDALLLIFKTYFRLKNSNFILPAHKNIVEMPAVFVDKIPLLADGFSLYPDALPKRINPSGFGRNMSLFCIMKRYNLIGFIRTS